MFHYTSFDALKKIVQGRFLLATHFAYLNDTEEFTLACKKIISMLRTCIGEWPRGNEERRKRIPRAELLLEAARRLLEERPNIFVVSFSTVGDLLSQWRSYTPDHYGVMLQFDRGCIESRAEGQGFVLRPCDYTREDAGNIEGIPLFIDKFTKVDGDPLLAQQELKLLAAGLKHLAFHEEREVRLIHNDGRDTFEHEGIPRMRFDLGDDASLCLTSITLGPTPAKDLRHDIEDVLNENGVAVPKVFESIIPYRPKPTTRSVAR